MTRLHTQTSWMTRAKQFTAAALLSGGEHFSMMNKRKNILSLSMGGMTALSVMMAQIMPVYADPTEATLVPGGYVAGSATALTVSSFGYGCISSTAVDTSGNVVVGGRDASSWPQHPQVLYYAQNSYNSPNTVFLDTTYSTWSQVNAVFTDGSGNVVVGGWDNSDNLQVLYYAQNNYGSPIPVFNNDGHWNDISGVFADGSGNVVVMGNGASSWQVLYYAQGDYNNPTTVFEDSGWNVMNTIVADQDGNVFVAGSDTNDTRQVIKYSLSESGYTAQTIIHGGWNDITASALDGAGNLFVVGQDTTNDHNWQIVPFLLSNGTYTAGNPILPTGWNSINSIALDSSGDIIIAGQDSSNALQVLTYSYHNNLIDSNGQSVTYSGAITGSYGLTIQDTGDGTGVVTLSGTNTYTGGTTISSGTLTITGSIDNSASITNNAALIFNQSSHDTYSHVISGSGSLTQSGTGTLTLSGINTYSGATTVSNGTLIGNISASLTLSAASNYVQGNPTVFLNIQDGPVQDWTQYTYTYTTGSNETQSYVLFQMQQNSNPEFLDHVSIVPSGSSTNVLINGDFETGNLTGWTVTNSFFGYPAVFNQFFNVDPSSGNWDVVGTPMGLSNLSQSFAVTPNTTYTLSFDFNNQFGGNGQQFIASMGACSAYYLGGQDQSLSNLSGGIGSIIGLQASASDATPRTLTLTNTAPVTVQSTITGTGGIVLSGSNLVTLSGANTYTGATTISSGTLAISSPNNIGSETLYLNGGTLKTTAALTLADVSVSADSIIDTQGNDLTLSVLSGSGNLSIIGGGVVTLPNDLSGFSGVITTVFAQGISQHDVALGNVLFTGTNDFSYGNVISGTGSLTQSGTGTLTLSETNTYSGETTISSGTLKITGSIDNSASITNNAALIFNQSSNDTYSHVISGTGTVTKQGTGTLTLSGTNTYTGDTTISSGTLITVINPNTSYYTGLNAHLLITQTPPV